MKIGRIGVNKEYQRRDIGTQMIDFIKRFFILENKTGCRFLTVDAYNKPRILKFYEDNGFTFYTEKDVNKQTRTMKYDLKPYSDKLKGAYANR